MQAIKCNFVDYFFQIFVGIWGLNCFKEIKLPKKIKNIPKISIISNLTLIFPSKQNDNIGLDSYNFGYETSDGIKREESAVVNNFGSDVEELVVRGTISWISPEGETINFNYVADKDGYRPEGTHIPA